MVFCFHQGRVFVTCMDNDCEQHLARNARSYFLMSKLVEEDIFGMSDASSPSSSTASSNSKRHRRLWCGNGGLAPCMLNDNPALRARAFAASSASPSSSASFYSSAPSFQHASAAGPPWVRGVGSGAAGAAAGPSCMQSPPWSRGAGSGAAGAGSMYCLSSADAPAVLSRSQMAFLDQLCSARDEMLSEASENRRRKASAAAAAGGWEAREGGGDAREKTARHRINVRDSCKVPWRCARFYV